MIDIGVNLLHAQFDADRDAVLERARAHGVQLILTSTSIEETRRAIAYCNDYPDTTLGCTAGVHPHDAGGADADWLTVLADYARQRPVHAIGEAGLDYFRNFSPREAQRAVFGAQIELAVATDKPLFVHDRDSGGETLELLHQHGAVSRDVVIHCFTGTEADLEAYLDAGYMIGITGWVCDRRRGESLRALIPRIPLHRLMIETDAPYLRPHNAPPDEHGRRNEPALLPYVVTQLAELYGESAETISAATAANARRFFRLPPVAENASH